MDSVELFAGAGGLAMGLCAAGFHPRLVVEWDKDCSETIRHNSELGIRPMVDWPFVSSDVHNISFAQFEDRVALVSGGPPCQPFSLGGKHRGHQDSRDMFPEAIRAVRESRPLAFMFENVKGLLRSKFANYFEYIKLQLAHPEVTIRSHEDWLDHLARLEQHHTSGREQGLEYKVVVELLNAANYGVPQKRERVIMVGFRVDLEVEWSFPRPTHSETALHWAKWGSGEYWKEHGIRRVDRLRQQACRLVECELPRWRTVRDTIADLPDPERQPRLAAEVPNHRFQPGARAYPGHTGSPLDEPAKTLKAGGHGVPGGENMLRRLDGSVRYFSVRESARLQTFPDEYAFTGSWTETMRQLGNAVPPTLATVVAQSIFNKLDELDERERKREEAPTI